jgi:hypothetical protein
MTAAPRRLPVLGPIEPRDLARFDRTESSRLALGVLYAKLGLWRFVRALVAFVLRGVFADPSKVLGKPASRDDELTRIQLRPVLLLDDVLTRNLALPREQVLGILRSVVAASGARFLEVFMPTFERAEWQGATDAARESFAGGLVSRLFNARVSSFRTDAEGLAFDVAECRFVAALRALDRMHLGPLFCAVDAAYVDRPGSNLLLERSGTLATGATRCDFRFTMKTGDE